MVFLRTSSWEREVIVLNTNILKLNLISKHKSTINLPKRRCKISGSIGVSQDFLLVIGRSRETILDPERKGPKEGGALGENKKRRERN